MSDFREDLIALINTHSMENVSDTPDWILAEYLIACLKTFDAVTEAREEWYGRRTSQGCTLVPGLGNIAIKTDKDAPTRVGTRPAPIR